MGRGAGDAPAEDFRIHISERGKAFVANRTLLVDQKDPQYGYMSVPIEHAHPTRVGSSAEAAKNADGVVRMAVASQHRLAKLANVTSDLRR